MHAALVWMVTAVAAPLPTKVERANGWPEVPKAGLRQPSATPRIFLRVTVGTRNRAVIREWRDHGQFYAIFWTAKTDGYRAFEIVDGKYRPLPTDGDPRSRATGDPRGRATLWPTLEDAANQVDNHWRGVAGQEQLPYYEPSPKLKRILQERAKRARR